jgi:hypothetical protein
MPTSCSTTLIVMEAMRTKMKKTARILTLNTRKQALERSANVHPLEGERTRKDLRFPTTMLRLSHQNLSSWMRVPTIRRNRLPGRLERLAGVISIQVSIDVRHELIIVTVDRKKGDTLPAYHRKVTVSPDEVDLLMLDMREKGFSDQQISEKLAKDCQVVYNVKTISTRISRIRLAQAENMDFQLKEGYKEWQLEDVFVVSLIGSKAETNERTQDQILIQAYALANIEVNYEIERVRAWRFRKVAEYMRRLKKDALFSANACRERYSALIEGTARIPSEVADDPEASRAELAALRKEREKARLEAEAKKSNQTALRKRRKDEAAAHAAQRAEEAANKRAAKEAEKADRARKRAEKAQERAQSALRIQKEKQERHSRAKKHADRPVDDAVAREIEPPAEKPRAPIKTTVILASKPTLPKKPALTFSSKTPDPRSSLSLPDLRRLCVARGFRVSGKAKKMLLSDIQNEERKWKLSNLKTMCKSKGLATSGTKPLLRHRLALSNVNEFVLFDSEMEATQVQSEEDSDGNDDNGERDGDDEEGITDNMSLDVE